MDGRQWPEGPGDGSAMCEKSFLAKPPRGTTLLSAQAPEPLSRHRLVALIQIHAEQRPSEADQEIDSIHHRRVLRDTKINIVHVFIIIKTAKRENPVLFQLPKRRIQKPEEK